MTDEIDDMPEDTGDFVAWVEWAKRKAVKIAEGEIVSESSKDDLGEYEASPEHESAGERFLKEQLAKMLDDAFQQSVPMADAVGAIAQVLYNLVLHDNKEAIVEGKVLSLRLEPFQCGCLCVAVQQVEPMPNDYDSDGCALN
jgi:hypothetical protein